MSVLLSVCPFNSGDAVNALVLTSMVPAGSLFGRARMPPAVKFRAASSSSGRALAHEVRGFSFLCCARSRASYLVPSTWKRWQVTHV